VPGDKVIYYIMDP